VHTTPPPQIESAEPLAALRIVVALLIVISPELHAAPSLAADPFTLLRVPEGLGLLSQVRLGPGVARGLEIVATSAGACAMLGYWSRTSLLVLTLAGGLAFSLSQYAGAVIHDMHLFWFSALLAASRSGDAWSLDAWGRPPPAPSRTYGVPLAFARALLGAVYFFPGVHKLARTGLAWFSAESISRELHHKWFEFGEVPALRPDLHPLLLTCGAVAIVAFELSFGVLAQLRRTRLWAACAGLAFHAATRLFFFIQFPSLWGTYVMLLPLGQKRTRDRRAAASALEWPGALESPSALEWPRTPMVVGALLLLAAIVQGVRGQTQAWPFACYPTFASIPSATIDDLAFEATLADGSSVHFSGREHGARGQFEWRRVYTLTGAYGDPPDSAALADFAHKVAARDRVPLAGAKHLVALRETFSTEPGRWEHPVASSRLLELTLPKTE